MSKRWLKINCSLILCRKVFAILKKKNPDLIPNYIDILAYRKNNKNCSISDVCQKLGIEDDVGAWIAHFDDRGEYNESTDEWETAGHRPHVCLKQWVLFFPLAIPTCEDDPDNVPKKRMQWIEGNWCLIEIMCHELTHPTHLGHGKKFFKLYYKFLSQMAQVVISGEFYNWYSRQYQSKKRSGKGNKQTAETKEWVDNYLAWK